MTLAPGLVSPTGYARGCLNRLPYFDENSVSATSGFWLDSLSGWAVDNAGSILAVSIAYCLWRCSK